MSLDYLSLTLAKASVDSLTSLLLHWAGEVLRVKEPQGESLRKM